MVYLQLDKMTVEEKLQAMEALWADLCRTEDNILSPPWHGDILRDRAARIERGNEAPEDWETAKRHIRDEIR